MCTYNGIEDEDEEGGVDNEEEEEEEEFVFNDRIYGALMIASCVFATCLRYNNQLSLNKTILFVCMCACACVCVGVSVSKKR